MFPLGCGAVISASGSVSEDDDDGGGCWGLVVCVSVCVCPHMTQQLLPRPVSAPPSQSMLFKKSQVQTVSE